MTSSASAASPQINRDNVKQLGLVWFADYDTNLRQDGTPLYIDGVIYVSTAWSKVYAFDARSGKTALAIRPQDPGRMDPQRVLRHRQSRHRRLERQDLSRHARWPPGGDRRTHRQGGLVDADHRQEQALLDHQRAARGQRARCSSASPAASTACAATSAPTTRETGKLDWRFYTVPGNPKDGFENAAMKKAARDLGRRSGGSSAAAARCGMRFVYDPEDGPRLLRHRQRLAVERSLPRSQDAATTCIWRRSSR